MKHLRDMTKYFCTLFLLGVVVFCHASSQDSLSISELMALQDYQSAAERLTIQDSSKEQQIMLGTCYYRLGNWRESKDILGAVTKIDTYHVVTNVMLASIYDQEFNMPKAIRHYSALVQVNPTNPTYVKNLARAHTKAGLHRIAKEMYWEARNLNEQDITILVSLADQAFRDREWTLADSLADLGLALDSSNLQVILTKSRAAYAQKRYHVAVRYLEKTRSKLDILPFYQKMLGYAYLQLDSLDKSIHVLENLLYREESEHTYFYLALAYQKKDEPTLAIHHYDKAITQGISGNLGKYYAGLAKVYREEAKLREALTAYGEAYHYTDNALYLFQKAQLSEQYYKDKKLALDQYRKCVATGTLSDEQLAFANDRIRLLKEYLHQQGR